VKTTPKIQNSIPVTFLLEPLNVGNRNVVYAGPVDVPGHILFLGEGHFN